MGEGEGHFGRAARHFTLRPFTHTSFIVFGEWSKGFAVGGAYDNVLRRGKLVHVVQCCRRVRHLGRFCGGTTLGVTITCHYAAPTAPDDL